MMEMNQMNELDLNLLTIFDAVWRHKHIGRASEELELSQPALSHALNRLRGKIGDALFVKVPAGMQPTARAVQLEPIVQSILASVREHVLTMPRFDPGNACRSFTIALTDVGEMVLLPKLLGRVMAVAPAVDIRTTSMPTRDLMTALRKGEVDLAIGYYPDMRGSDILQQRLFREGFVSVVRADHPVVRGKLTQKQFRDLPHVVVQTEARSPEMVKRHLRSHGLRRRELLRSPHFLSIPMVIASTDLIATVPESIGELLGRIIDAQILQPPFPIPPIDVRQYWHRSQHHGDPGNQWLRSVVVALFAYKPSPTRESRSVGASR
jgi:DNA-binding transcriptional LysR family regulator